MTENEIISRLFARDESALQALQQKYGAYCRTIARNILSNSEDAEECENESLFKVWNAIPPSKPKSLLAFLGKITRNTALDAYERRIAAKRGGGQAEIVFSEVEEIIGTYDMEQEFDGSLLTETLNHFLSELPKQQRIILLRRYIYFHSIGEIAQSLTVSESKVKSVLFRLRKKLKTRLETEGIF